MLEFKYDTQLLIEGEDLDEDVISEYFTENFKGEQLLPTHGYRYPYPLKLSLFLTPQFPKNSVAASWAEKLGQDQRGMSCACVMLDLDRFKSINDTYERWIRIYLSFTWNIPFSSLIGISMIFCTFAKNLSGSLYNCPISSSESPSSSPSPEGFLGVFLRCSSICFW